MPTSTRTVYLTDENGNPLIDEQRNLRTLSFSLMQGYSYRLVERASIVSATYAQVVGYSTATGQTISGVENASEFDVGDFGIVQYAISDRNNTIGYVTCKVTAVGVDSLTVNGIGISVSGADGADGKDGAPGADGKDGAATVQIGTVTTGAAGSQASVTNVGADNAAILNFTIPRGDTGAAGRDGTNGQDGAPGAAATIQIGQVLTGEPGTNASVENVGTSNAAILNITIPRGNPGTNGTNGTDGAPGQDGADGAAATIQIGEVVTGAAGTNATVENTGTENAAILKFTIPRGATGTPGADGQDGAPGADGAAATIEVGEVATGAAGTQASVTNSGTANAAVLDFTIPQGADGASGVTDVTAGSPTEQNGYTVTPVTFNFEQGNSKTVNIQAKNGAGAGVQQNAIINRTVSVDTADESSPDFVENGGDLWVKKITGYEDEVNALETTLPNKVIDTSAATAHNGKIYIFGGSALNGTIDNIVELDPIAQTAKVLETTLPVAIYSTSATTAPNGKIYIFGGITDSSRSNEIIEFDPVTKSVTKLKATLPVAINYTSAVTASNGNVYVFGGRADNNIMSNKIIEFDPVAKSVITLETTLPSELSETSAALAPNGKIYIFGGTTNSSRSNEIIEFDPVTKSATKLETTLPSDINGTSAATASNSKIYIFGGYNGDIEVDIIVEFDPTSQSVTSLSVTLPSGRAATSAATAHNGRIYVLGGYYDATIFDQIVEFSPDTAKYAYSPAVVLSQAEYAQLKNILKGIFEVGISTPSATVNGAVNALSFNTTT